MGEKIRLGNRGENAAAAYLLGKGYEILAKNYRFGRAEVDLIARLDKTLVFIEVKTRSSNRYGYPEKAVNAQKEKLFLLAAEEYVYETEWPHEVRFDVIAVTGDGPSCSIHHIEDAFH